MKKGVLKRAAFWAILLTPLLESQFGIATRNLGIGSYATTREVEVLDKYGKDAKYIIIQYCDNDWPENFAALRLSKEDFRSEVEKGWRDRISTYNQGKAMGYSKALHDLAIDTTKILDFGDYYSLDGHPNPTGHRKLAAAFAREISECESADPLLKKR